MGANDRVQDLAFSGDLVVGVGISYDRGMFWSEPIDSRVAMWIAQTGDEVRRQDWLCRTCNAIAVTANGFYVGHDHLIGFYNWREPEAVREFVGHEGTICKLAVSPNGRFLGSYASDHRIRVWKAESGEFVAQFFPRE